MKTRRSWRNQNRLWKQLGEQPKASTESPEQAEARRQLENLKRSLAWTRRNLMR